MSRNNEVADLLDEFADLLEAQDVEYKPRAYRNAAESIDDLSVAIEGLAADGPDRVAEIDAVGDAISAKIVEYVETGEIAELEAVREELPVEMDALTRIEGVGPKTVGTLYEELGVQTLADLEAAAEAGEIQELYGFGATTEQNILEGIDFARQADGRELLARALPRADRVLAFLDGVTAVERVELGGSIRRRRPTIGDVDVLVGSEDGAAVVDAFTAWEVPERVVEAGSEKASVRLDGVRVDLRVVDPAEFGAALQYFTGSKTHNVAVRNRAIDRDLKLNEYGLFDISAVESPDAGQRVGERVAGPDEAGVYAALGMEHVSPELREDRGEVAAAVAGDLPDLLTRAAPRGDLHTHTNWSDGAASIEEMVGAADAFGHEYLAITDHATGPGMVGGVGLDDEQLREQLPAIREVNDEADIEVLAGVEANIDTEGAVSVDDDLLARLDIVVASPHIKLDGDGTDRLVTAAKHPEVDIVGHPTGRQLNKRSGMTVDVERLASRRRRARHRTRDKRKSPAARPPGKRRSDRNRRRREGRRRHGRPHTG
ncbi:MAG: DNA polymerase IV (family X) [halophilic archaeon J07HX64]|jgi:DNA polymerase IV (family X)|nr:MAG: DNA polymerase IV (family X) [halophilic archaeon J07HX64]